MASVRKYGVFFRVIFVMVTCYSVACTTCSVMWLRHITICK